MCWSNNVTIAHLHTLNRNTMNRFVHSFNQLLAHSYDVMYRSEAHFRLIRSGKKCRIKSFHIFEFCEFVIFMAHHHFSSQLLVYFRSISRVINHWHATSSRFDHNNMNISRSTAENNINSLPRWRVYANV